MAKISELPTTTSLTGAETVPLVQSGVTKTSTLTVIKNWITSTLTGYATSGANSNITSLSGLTTPLSVPQGGTGVATITGIVKGNGTSVFSAAIVNTDYTTPSGIQAQAVTSTTTSGTASAYIATMSPSITGLVANKTRVNLTFHASNSGAASTLNVDSTGVVNIKQYDSTGTKIDPIIIANMNADILYDGTNWVILDSLPASTGSFSPPVRHTVLNGPVDSNGFAAFGGSTGSTTVTASGILTVTAANGVTTTGNVDKTFQITNPSWTGLSTNGTMYLYVDWNSGSPITGSTTLAPTYQWGGTYSTTSNQHTFNIQEMTMKVGNGAAATQTYRVFVGEVTVAGGVTTAITWYALMRQYVSASTALPAAATAQSFNHNIGIPPEFLNWTYVGVCTSAIAGFSVGDRSGPSIYSYTTSAVSGDIRNFIDKKTCQIIAESNSGFAIKTKGTGVSTLIGTANFNTIQIITGVF